MSASNKTEVRGKKLNSLGTSRIEGAYAETKWEIWPGKNRGLEYGKQAKAGKFKGRVEKVRGGRAQVRWWHRIREEDQIPERFTIYLNKGYNYELFKKDQKKRDDQATAPGKLDRDTAKEYDGRG
jgi:hypothetical protein